MEAQTRVREERHGFKVLVEARYRMHRKSVRRTRMYDVRIEVVELKQGNCRGWGVI